MGERRGASAGDAQTAGVADGGMTADADRITPGSPGGGTPDGAGVEFVTLGCKVNQAESDAIAGELAATGVAIGGRDEAWVVVVNTCTVTAEADAKARKAVRRALARPGRPRVIVTGCLAAVDPQGVAALGEGVIVEADKALVAERARALAPATRVGVGPAERRARVQVKVHDGCDAYCAYCIVPYARGVPRSVPAERVVARVRQLHASGTGEVVLTGINIGRYDDAGMRLSGLLDRVVATGVRRVRISSIEPDDVTGELLDAMRHPRVAPHMHLPLQSGCDATLAAMGRRYDTAGYAAVVARVRDALPGVAVTTDMLVGFPGETDEHFERSLSFAREMRFSRLHVFRYSVRPGTVAAELPAHVPAAVLAERSARARALGEQLAAGWAAGLVGRDVSVLVERCAGGEGEGTSAEYVRVRFRTPGGRMPAVGDIVRVRVTGACGAAVTGDPID